MEQKPDESQPTTPLSAGIWHIQKKKYPYLFYICFTLLLLLYLADEVTVKEHSST